VGLIQEVCPASKATFVLYFSLTPTLLRILSPVKKLVVGASEKLDASQVCPECSSLRGPDGNKHVWKGWRRVRGIQRIDVKERKRMRRRKVLKVLRRAVRQLQEGREFIELLCTQMIEAEEDWLLWHSEYFDIIAKWMEAEERVREELRRVEAGQQLDDAEVRETANKMKELARFGDMITELAEECARRRGWK